MIFNKLVNYYFKPRFPKFFFAVAPLKKIKKAFNEITQKHLRPFFCSSSATQE